VHGKQVSSVRRAFDPVLEHVAPYFPDPYRPFICPTGSEALRIDPSNKQKPLIRENKEDVMKSN